MKQKKDLDKRKEIVKVLEGLPACKECGSHDCIKSETNNKVKYPYDTYCCNKCGWRFFIKH